MKLLFAGADPTCVFGPNGDGLPEPLQALVACAPEEDLSAAVQRHAPDIVLLRTDKLDRAMLDGMERVAAVLPGPILVLVDQDDPELMEAAIAAGIGFYLKLDAVRFDAGPAIRGALALFRRERALREALRRLNDEGERQRVLDRAKRLLIRNRRLSEPDAYRWLRREAMRSGRRLQEVAAEIVRTYGETAADPSERD